MIPGSLFLSLHNQINGILEPCLHDAETTNFLQTENYIRSSNRDRESVAPTGADNISITLFECCKQLRMENLSISFTKGRSRGLISCTFRTSNAQQSVTLELDSFHSIRSYIEAITFYFKWFFHSLSILEHCIFPDLPKLYHVQSHVQWSYN